MERLVQLLRAMPEEIIRLSRIVNGVILFVLPATVEVVHNDASLTGISFRDHRRWIFPCGWRRNSGYTDFFVRGWDWKCAPNAIQEEVRRWHDTNPAQIPHDKARLSIHAQQHATANAVTLTWRIYHQDVEPIYNEWLPKQKLAVLTALQRKGSILHRCMQRHPLYDRHLWFAIFEATWPRAAFA